MQRLMQTRNLRTAGFVAVGLLCSAGFLSAQWFRYPTEGVPRLANGKPNLKAPAPKTADGKPDLSGVWLISNALPCPKDLRDGDDCIEKIPLSHEAVDFGANVAGGLPYQPWAAALVKQRVADLSKDDPHARCMPPNFPRAFAFPHHQKFIQIPGLLVILDEFNASYRQIFTDARPFPDDPQPSWNGYSSGKWEGDTLVVKSIGFRNDLWLDMTGNPMTEAAKVTERFRRLNYGSLEIEVTVNDPKAYTKPWTVTLNQAIQVDTELVDEICLENEQSVRHMTGK
jgi:hypothetical protein